MLEKECVGCILEEIHSMRRQMEEYEEHVQLLENELFDLKTGSVVSGKKPEEADVSRDTLKSTSAVLEEPLEDIEDDADEVYNTPEDIYTLMYFAPVMSTSFFFGMFIFGVQVLILGLIVADLLADDLPVGADDGNTFNVPVENSTTVHIAQIIATVIAVVSRDDVTDSIDLLSFGHLKGIKDLLAGATRSKFYVVNLLRLFQGSFVIFVSFTFIVQADNVLDLFLNFAAIEFVAGLDNLAWELASSGWLLSSMQKMTQSIRETDIMITSADKNRMFFNQSIAKTALLLLLIGGLFYGWLNIYLMQTNGSLLEATTCGTLEVHFGDQVLELSSSADYTPFETFTVPSMNTDKYNVTRLAGSKRTLGASFDTSDPPDLLFSSFSGNYWAYYDPLVNDRPFYYERGFDDPTSGKFYYCDTERAWVFTIEAIATANGVPQNTISRCGDDGWLMISPETDSYSLEDAPTSGWKVWTGSLEEAEDFSVSCTECSNDVDCGITHGTCGDNNICTCSPGYAGNFCNHDAPCDDMVLYFEKIIPYLMSIPSYFSVRAYERWIYQLPDKEFEYLSDEEFEFLFYNGRRWYDAYLRYAELLIYFDKASGQEDLSVYEVFNLGFHSYWSGVLQAEVVYFSEPTDSFAPTGPLQWYAIKKSRSHGSYGIFGVVKEVIQQLECVSVDCSIDTVCGVYGTCKHEDRIILGEGSLQTNSSGNVCVCESTFTGHFCEYENVLYMDKEGNVFETEDIDPFLGACFGPFSWWPHEECYEKLYLDLWD